MWLVKHSIHHHKSEIISEEGITHEYNEDDFSCGSNWSNISVEDLIVVGSRRITGGAALTSMISNYSKYIPVAKTGNLISCPLIRVSESNPLPILE